jgi:hypothetical protein
MLYNFNYKTLLVLDNKVIRFKCLYAVVFY